MARSKKHLSLNTIRENSAEFEGGVNAAPERFLGLGQQLGRTKRE